MNKLKNLENYYDKNISLGPNETRGNINYDYTNSEIVVKFLDILLIEKKIKNLCIPNFKTKYKNSLITNTIIYNTENDKHYLSTEIYEGFIKCLDSKKRFIYFYFVLENMKHGNMVLIDTKKKTIERFEPFGWDEKNKSFINIQNKIDNFFNKTLIGYLGLKKYKYINPKKIYNKFGIQYVADSYCGMCLTICIMYLHMRIINENATQKQIVSYFMKKKKEELKKKILKYTKYIERKLKN